MRKFNGLLCGLLMAAGSVAQAQVTTTQTTVTTTTPANPEVRRVSQILGSTVQLQGVNNFGKVEDIVLDNNGGIGYLVVSSADGKYTMLPWNAGNVNYGRRIVTYDVTPQAIQPFYFERNVYPNFTAPEYVTRVRRVFPNLGRVRTPGVVVPPGGP